ncbi:MAG: hypothetical protein LBN32_04940 [Helicobacteraceae bacterium]|nr:hypothetical protein [Helicobacteraceae bacterium]
MKNAKTIIEHLYFSDQRWQQRCFLRALFAFLPQAMKEAVLYAKLQNKTLTIKLSSQTMKAEFYYKRDLLKDLFRKLVKERAIEGAGELEHVRLLVDYENSATIAPPPLAYEERSNGNFENNAENKAVFDTFEAIRETIRKNKKRA